MAVTYTFNGKVVRGINGTFAATDVTLDSGATTNGTVTCPMKYIHAAILQDHTLSASSMLWTNAGNGNIDFRGATTASVFSIMVWGN